MPARLPQPITVTDHYLAAVLEELRVLNDTMQALTQRASTAASTSTKPNDGNVRSNNKPRKDTVEHIR